VIPHLDGLFADDSASCHFACNFGLKFRSVFRISLSRNEGLLEKIIEPDPSEVGK